MWLLFLLLVTELAGVPRVTALSTFSSQTECVIERDRIRLEMANAYPNDADYIIDCGEIKHGRLIYEYQRGPQLRP